MRSTPSSSGNFFTSNLEVKNSMLLLLEYKRIVAAAMTVIFNVSRPQ